MQRLFFAAVVLGAISALRKKDPDPYYLKVKRVSFISPVNDTVMYYDNEVGAVVLFFIAFEIVEHLGEVHRDEGKFWGLDIRAGRHEHPWVHSHDDEHDYDDSVRLPISTTGWAEYDYTHKHLKHMPGPRQMVQHCPHNCSVFSLTLRKGKWTVQIRSVLDDNGIRRSDDFVSSVQPAETITVDVRRMCNPSMLSVRLGHGAAAAVLCAGRVQAVLHFDRFFGDSSMLLGANELVYHALLDTALDALLTATEMSGRPFDFGIVSGQANVGALRLENDALCHGIEVKRWVRTARHEAFGAFGMYSARPTEQQSAVIVLDSFSTLGGLASLNSAWDAGISGEVQVFWGEVGQPLSTNWLISSFDDVEAQAATDLALISSTGALPLQLLREIAMLLPSIRKENLGDAPFEPPRWRSNCSAMCVEQLAAFDQDAATLASIGRIDEARARLARQVFDSPTPVCEPRDDDACALINYNELAHALGWAATGSVDDQAELLRSAQHALGEFVVHELLVLLSEVPATDNMRVVLTGGAVMNEWLVGHVSMQLYQRTGERVYVPPAPGHEGLVIGAAWWWVPPARSNTPARLPALQHAGMLPWDVRDWVDYSQLVGRYGEMMDMWPITAEDIANLLHEHPCIGMIRGREALGGRTLGRRSLICAPVADSLRMVRHITGESRYRLPSLVVPVETAHLYIDSPAEWTSPYSSFGVQLSASALPWAEWASITGGRVRVQTVSSDDDRYFHAFLTLLGRLEGDEHLAAVLEAPLRAVGGPVLNSVAAALQLLDVYLADRGLGGGKAWHHDEGWTGGGLQHLVVAETRSHPDVMFAADPQSRLHK